MRRLVINLDSSTDRLESVRREFAGIGLTFDRFPAVRRDDLTDELVQQVAKPHLHGYHWSRSEIACFLSHRECWKIAASSGEDYTAIFEDDIHLAPDSAPFLRDASWIPRGIEIIKLETWFQGVRLGLRKSRIGDHTLSELHSMHWGSAGYIVSAWAAESLLRASESFDRSVDEFIFDQFRKERAFPCHQLSPAICIQDSFLHSGPIPLNSVINKDRVSARSVPLQVSDLSVGHKLAGLLGRAARLLRSAPAKLRKLTTAARQRTIIPFAHSSITSESLSMVGRGAVSTE